MPSNKNELAQRLALAKPHFSTRGLFFNSILKLVEQRAGTTGMNEVKVGILKQPLSDFRSYPIAEFLNLLFRTADVLERSLGPQEAVFEACGSASVLSFAKSGVGAVVFGILGKGNPLKLLAGTDGAYRSVVNYGQRVFVATGEKSGTLTVREDMVPPAYHVGIFKAGLDSLGFRGAVTTRTHGLESCDYLCSWE